MSHCLDPPCQQSNGAQTRRNKLLQDAEMHEHALIAIRRELNTLVPVGRLPPELLVAIFHYFAALQKNGLPVNLISVTHVCHLWRKVALGAETLWATINATARPDYLDVALRRSGGTLLDVYIKSAYHQSHQRTLHAILPHIHRFSSLEIVDWFSVSHFFPDPVHAPELQILRVIRKDTARKDATPSTIFSRLLSTPKLHTLQHNARTDIWRSLAKLPSLKHLDLTGGVELHLNEVAETLRCLPSLEHLRLYCQWLKKPQFNDSLISVPIITLPWLRTAILSGYIVDSCRLLALISTPSITRIDLPHYTKTCTTEADLKALADLCRPVISKLLTSEMGSLKPLLCLSIHHDSLYDNYYTLRGWADDQSTAQDDRMQLSFSIPMYKHLVFYDHFTRHLPLDTVRLLQLSPIKEMMRGWELLHHFSSVEELRLEPCYVWEFAALIDKSSDGRYNFPSLRVVKATELYFEPRSKSDETCDSGICHHILKNILVIRQAEAPIEQLTIFCPRSSPEALSELNGVVPRLEIITREVAKKRGQSMRSLDDRKGAQRYLYD